MKPKTFDPAVTCAQLQKYSAPKEHEIFDPPGAMSAPSGPETRLLKPICSPTKRNNSRKINRWR